MHNRKNLLLISSISILTCGLLLSGCGKAKEDTGLDSAANSSLTISRVLDKVEDTITSDEEGEDPVLPANISFNHSFASGKEYAEIIAYDANAEEMWRVLTDGYDAAQLDQISQIGLLEDRYYYVDGGAIVCLDGSTGVELWRNADFGGASIHYVFDSDKDLFVCGYYGPDLFGVDADGQQIIRIDDADDDFMWPCQLSITDNQVKITYESGNINADGGTIGVSIDGKTLEPYSYTENSLSAANGGAIPEGSQSISADTGSNENNHSDDELCRMALDYYERHNGERPGNARIDSVNGNMVTIQVYDDMDDHTATLAWYEVDRTTAIGTDVLFGDEINLMD